MWEDVLFLFESFQRQIIVISIVNPAIKILI